MNQTKEVKPFGIKDKLGYMMGDFGNDFTFILSTMLLTKFYTDVMGFIHLYRYQYSLWFYGICYLC